jgi:hypothetical protein
MEQSVCSANLAHSMSEIAIPAIERERAARIAKNKEELRKLGLYSTPKKGILSQKKINNQFET